MSRLILVVFLVSCGGGPKQSAAPHSAPAAETAGQPSPISDPHAELDALARAIEDDRAKLELAEPAPQVIEVAPRQPMAQLSSTTDPKCKPAATERCTGSCKLSESICTNAGKICKLAEGLPGDRKAEQTCKRANATCDAAHAKCCGCR